MINQIEEFPMTKQDSLAKTEQITTSGQAKKLSGFSRKEREEITKRLVALAEATSETCSMERIALYLQTLCDLPFAKVCEVLESMLTTARWFPKIPDIREAVLGGPNQDAAEAWEKITRLIPRWRMALENECDTQASGFTCGTATFDLPDDPVLRRALLRMGGARAMACMNPANLNLVKKDFISEYSNLKKEHPELLEITDGNSPKITGVFKTALAEVVERKRMPT